jgi:hypothetical protein
MAPSERIRRVCACALVGVVVLTTGSFSASETILPAPATRSSADAGLATVTIPEVVVPETEVSEWEYLLENHIPLDIFIQRDIYRDVCGGDPERFCLLMAIAAVETGFDAKAVGDDGGSVGMFQINTAAQGERIDTLGVTDLFDAVQCATVAMDYIDWIAERIAPENPSDAYGSDELFMAYNMGYFGSQCALASGITSTAYSRCAGAAYAAYLEVMQS